MGHCCESEDFDQHQNSYRKRPLLRWQDHQTQNTEVMQRIRRCSEHAADFKVKPEDHHRYKLLESIGIYHEQVKVGALHSGNANVIKESHEKIRDLRSFYTVVGSEPQEVNFDTFLRYGNPLVTTEKDGL